LLLLAQLRSHSFWFTMSMSSKSLATDIAAGGPAPVPAASAAPDSNDGLDGSARCEPALALAAAGAVTPSGLSMSSAFTDEGLEMDHFKSSTQIDFASSTALLHFFPDSAFLSPSAASKLSPAYNSGDTHGDKGVAPSLSDVTVLSTAAGIRGPGSCSLLFARGAVCCSELEYLAWRAHGTYPLL
jgi:hypothetical protein